MLAGVNAHAQFRRCRHCRRNLVAALLAALAWLALARDESAGTAPALQPLIDATPTGGTLRPSPGRYRGPAVVTRPITIDGGAAATIDGGGRGTVLTLRSDGATLRALRISGSGSSHDAIDAAILIEGDDNRVEDNVIDDALFGIHVRQADRNLIRANRIRSKQVDLNMRGDGLRLWNSRNNLIEGNTLQRVRDLTLANSPGNRVAGNAIAESRYGMHLIFSPGTLAERNLLSANATGVVVLYSDDVSVRGNRIVASNRAGGVGIAFKDSNGALVEDNDIVRCTVGIEANTPLHPENAITIRRNRIAHNTTGLYFYGERGGHVLHDNRFDANLTTIALTSPAGARDNDWRGNWWDDYEGFDRDRDGRGDTAFEMWAFADRIWMEIPVARFFRASPSMELLDFLERLAPFSEPQMILRDPVPRLDGAAGDPAGSPVSP
jgi:nitrous oxidase accessory protein